MELGMIGLGRMGANMTERLLLGGHRVVIYDRSPEAIQSVVDKGALGAKSLADFANQLSLPRAIWLMVPSGDPVDQTIEQLRPIMAKGDVIIDGGNSDYKDSIRRAERLKQQGFHFVDAGTSGGIWGLKVGYCMMVGGDKTVPEAIDRSVPAPVLRLSLFARFASRQDDSFAAKVTAALRNEFGDHAVKKD